MFPGGSASGLGAPSFRWCQFGLRGSADWFTSSTRVLPRPGEMHSPRLDCALSRDDWSLKAESLVRNN
eukprot:6477209-Amphidinium_carterae.1